MRGESNQTLRLYTNHQSRGRIAHWMLEEIGQPYELVEVEYGAAMKSADFLSINPMGKVPTLVHQNDVVTECAAICAYLADTFPESQLGPTPAERADYYRWLFFASGPFESAVTNKTLAVEHDPNKESMLGYGSLSQVLDTLEDTCAQQDFIAGSRFTAADVYVGSQIGFSMMFGSIEKRDAFVDYWSRCSDRVAYRKVNSSP